MASPHGSTIAPLWHLILLSIAFLNISGAVATRLFESSSLNSCMQNSSFTTSLFRVTFTPDNNTLSFDINGYSLQSAPVVIGFTVFGYGYKVVPQKLIDPCSPDNKDLQGLCPMPAAPIQILGNSPISSDELKKIPSISLCPRFIRPYADWCRCHLLHS
jgi:hypothetical protein